MSVEATEVAITEMDITEVTTAMVITTTGVTSIFSAVATTEGAMSRLIVNADFKVVGRRTLAVATEEEGIAAVVVVAMAVAAMDGDPHNAFDKTYLIIL
jgi:hypothetical protein